MPAPVNIPSATAVKTVTANGGNLFRIALDNLGDPLQWARVAAANSLIDPFLPSNSTIILTVPPVNSAFVDSGVLRPRGAPASLAATVAPPPPRMPPHIPVSLTIPEISGSPQVGHVLTASTGTWTNVPVNFVYQWISSGGGPPISGATTSIYIPTVADIGNTLTVTVIAINSAGISLPSTSVATSAVIAGSSGMFNNRTSSGLLVATGLAQ
jgi:hypothetical protein